MADVDNGWGECIVPIGSEIYAYNVRVIHVVFCLMFLIILFSML